MKSSLPDLICHLDNMKLLPKISLQSRAFYQCLISHAGFQGSFCRRVHGALLLTFIPRILPRISTINAILYRRPYRIRVITFLTLEFSPIHFLFLLLRITLILSFLPSLSPRIHPSVQFLNISTRINCYSHVICYKKWCHILSFQNRIICYCKLIKYHCYTLYLF